MIVAEKELGGSSGTLGLECPICGCPQSTVIWTRKRVLKINGTVQGCIARARECGNENCGFRFTTRERISEDSQPPGKS